ncbi:MAG: hybrid histidine kinase/response regulator HrmK [Rivularia sp. (in: Bacteria)]|nr:hybrid histidine kinase/response regulator HrmK [Rivularia sp. MS3]
MQQYSSLPEQNSQLDNSSIVLTTVEQLHAQLWLERSLNQLQTKLDDCLTSALFHARATSVRSAIEKPIQKIQNTQDRQTAITQTEIFETVVNELYALFNSNVVAFAAPTAVAIAVAQPEEEHAVYRIGYMSPQSNANSELSPVNLAVGKDKSLQLKLNSEIDIEDLQQLGKQQPQAAFCFSNDSLGIMGWLIVSSKSSPNSSNGLFVFEQILKLMAEAASMCRAALSKLKHIESLQQQADYFNNHNKELQRTNQLKNQFLANTSHEIRTPLSSIIGFTHLLLAQGYDPSRQRHHEYLNIIQSSGKHLLALINDILDLSKIEANQLEVNWETIDVPQLCRNVLALVKEKAANKGLQMQLDIDSNVTSIMADPLRLKQILLNLLFNAVKFTKTGTVGLEVKAGENLMYFTVWDTGIGISKENQSELFQPYFQIFNERQVNGEEGTGLGLTVTRKLAEIHGGSVEVESEIDKGSRFTIVIPIEQNTDAARGSDTDTTAKHKAENNKDCSVPNSLKQSSHILLVEDDIPNAELIKTYLEKLGYQLTWVNNASQMWNALNKQDYSVILIDIVLPDANGISLVKQLRQNRQYSNIAIIAQTAMAMKGDRDTCLDAGVNDYICKPIDLPLLAKILSEYITLP